LSEQTITLQSVLAYIDGRIETLAGNKPYVTSRAEELMKAREHFAAMVEYPVTFAEGNEVSGVSIQVYSDPEHQVPVGIPVATDASGEATVHLISGTYYFKATKADFVDYQGEFVVNHAEVTVPFTMQGVEHTVTFEEANTLEGVTIQVYADSEYQEPIGDPIVTDADGEATIDLVSGTYYFVATKEGYADKADTFTVTAADKTVTFEMEELFTVTFEEANTLEGVTIQVYADSEHQVPIGEPIMTDEKGEATIDLISGTYYYVATKEGFQNKEDSFVISDTDTPVAFEMETEL